MEQCLTRSGGKKKKKKFFVGNVKKKKKKKKWAPKIGSEIRFFCHFLKFVSLVFLDIAQICSLGHLVELKPQKIRAQIGAEMSFPAFSFIK